MNIAKILKYCPKGTKLYSTISGEVILRSVCADTKYPIEVVTYNSVIQNFTEGGLYWESYPDSECVLFPSKTQRDWSKFKLPIKDGDIMMTVDERAFIANGKKDSDNFPYAYCGINLHHDFTIGTGISGWTSSFYMPASEKAKKELFDKMAEAGYKWNTDILKLEKIESKIEEGTIIKIDNVLYLTTGIIKNNKLQTCCLMYDTTINVYEPEFNDGLINIATLTTKEERDKFYLTLIRYGYKYDKKQRKVIKQKFKPFDKVLVKNNAKEKWSINIFSYYDKEDKNYPYACLNEHYYYCIPYEGNEYLVGSSINP